ncbi:hypothetical protein SPBR_04493 [Sporothrix brasiliensis 5110]|uniref:Uncharacterized protein n=1 Tax=Sporothrix brasiliensis 5110 TaxID=1398154 RepID=A0A0C2J8L2_9PEZI|nr:uncharacterized protein SPBR_04493 [Sporothrix brasiliensis 5110]KIH93332.1 hypothetical protein SPBR_04493 [Sporothrix brasiliensis 5110]
MGESMFVGYLGITAENFLNLFLLDVATIHSPTRPQQPILAQLHPPHEAASVVLGLPLLVQNGQDPRPVTAIYPGSRLHLFEMLKTVRWEDYEIDYRSGNRFQFMGNGYTNCEAGPEGDPVWYFDDPFVRL